jgi:hypothetical protein
MADTLSLIASIGANKIRTRLDETRAFPVIFDEIRRWAAALSGLLEGRGREPYGNRLPGFRTGERAGFCRRSP